MDTSLFFFTLIFYDIFYDILFYIFCIHKQFFYTILRDISDKYQFYFPILYIYSILLYLNTPSLFHYFCHTLILIPNLSTNLKCLILQIHTLVISLPHHISSTMRLYYYTIILILFDIRTYTTCLWLIYHNQILFSLCSLYTILINIYYSNITLSLPFFQKLFFYYSLIHILSTILTLFYSNQIPHYLLFFTNCIFLLSNLYFLPTNTTHLLFYNTLLLLLTLHNNLSFFLYTILILSLSLLNMHNFIFILHNILLCILCF